jgi:hypothetical protein
MAGGSESTGALGESEDIFKMMAVPSSTTDTTATTSASQLIGPVAAATTSRPDRLCLLFIGYCGGAVGGEGGGNKTPASQSISSEHIISYSIHISRSPSPARLARPATINQRRIRSPVRRSSSFDPNFVLLVHFAYMY